MTLKVAKVYASVPQTLLLADPLWLRKTNKDTHTLAHVQIDYPDDTHAKLKIYTLKLIQIATITYR